MEPNEPAARLGRIGGGAHGALSVATGWIEVRWDARQAEAGRIFRFIFGQLVRGDEISCSRVYVVPFSAASFACRRAFNLVVFSSAWTGAPFALTGCFVTAANSASARVRCFEVSDIGYPLVTGWGAGRRALSVA